MDYNIIYKLFIAKMEIVIRIRCLGNQVKLVTLQEMIKREIGVVYGEKNLQGRILRDKICKIKHDVLPCTVYTMDAQDTDYALLMELKCRNLDILTFIIGNLDKICIHHTGFTSSIKLFGTGETKPIFDLHDIKSLNKTKKNNKKSIYKYMARPSNVLNIRESDDDQNAHINPFDKSRIFTQPKINSTKIDSSGSSNSNSNVKIPFGGINPTNDSQHTTKNIFCPNTASQDEHDMKLPDAFGFNPFSNHSSSVPNSFSSRTHQSNTKPTNTFEFSFQTPQPGANLTNPFGSNHPTTTFGPGFQIQHLNTDPANTFKFGQLYTYPTKGFSFQPPQSSAEPTTTFGFSQFNSHPATTFGSNRLDNDPTDKSNFDHTSKISATPVDSNLTSTIKNDNGLETFRLLEKSDYFRDITHPNQFNAFSL